MIDRDGLEFIKALEGYSATAYKDGAGVWTIGYGHTEGVTAQSPILTRDQAEQVLIADIEDFEEEIMKAVTVELTANEFVALLAFLFNIGLTRFLKSTLLEKLNSGDKLGVSKEFMRWVYITDPKTGKKIVSEGLKNRRRKESDLFAYDTRTKKENPTEA